LKNFWLVAKIFNLSVGVLSIILGILAVYDIFKFKKSGSTEGLLLQLPTAVKNQIHSVIGLHYRKPKGEESLQRISIVRLTFSALVTGFLVSILEAVCTGQTYLPTISFVLKTSPLKLQALGYLLLYNFMFIVPLLVILAFALWGVTSEQFAKILKKNLLSIKVLMAMLFFGLGIFLIWRV
jgi:cytochrome c biogenesis protein CcdA